MILENMVQLQVLYVLEVQTGFNIRVRAHCLAPAYIFAHSLELVVVYYIKVVLWSIAIIIYGFIVTRTLSCLILCL